ncbi:MAG TPA: sulfite exporter TauE/SafE family protein [Actinomycetota bacterium]|nr:sulfite exporter TauE/SafE family protein [Actinomycetota bacterium]
MTLVVAAALAAFAGGAIQSVSGFGYALLVVPVLTVVSGPRVAVVVMTAIGVPLVIANGWRWRARLRHRMAVLLVGTALLGIPLGALFLRTADERLLTATVGIVVIAMTIAIWRGLRVPPGTATLTTAGVLSGAFAASTGTNGPPVVIALDAEGLEPDAFRATLQTVFALEGSLAFVTFIVNGFVTASLVPAIVAGLIAVAAGAVVGDRIARRVDQARFRSIVLVTLAASGVLAVVSALTG